MNRRAYKKHLIMGLLAEAEHERLSAVPRVVRPKLISGAGKVAASVKHANAFSKVARHDGGRSRGDFEVYALTPSRFGTVEGRSSAQYRRLIKRTAVIAWVSKDGLCGSGKSPKSNSKN